MRRKRFERPDLREREREKKKKKRERERQTEKEMTPWRWDMLFFRLKNAVPSGKKGFCRELRTKIREVHKY